jgi:hypothetical protein
MHTAIRMGTGRYFKKKTGRNRQFADYSGHIDCANL